MQLDVGARRERFALSSPDAPHTIQQLFARQVTRAPEAVAIVHDGGALTYRQLDAYAEQLAYRLLERGVLPEERVAVCLERSPELVIALLAIVKAGAAYLPYDPQYPEERVRFMIEDSAARLVVTTRAHASSASGDLLCIDELTFAEPAEDTHERSGERLLPHPSDASGSEQLAYVCYTSGSTGKPKGVQVTHAGVLRLVHQVTYVELGPGRTVLHAAPPAFDATTFEIWGPLLTGGTCALFRENVPTASTLRAFLERQHVTTAFLTTALVNAVVDDDARALSGLSQLLFGGEAVSVGHVVRLQAACPDLQLVHVYGPTETTTFATAYRITGPVDARATTIPIGRPIEETTAHVLDAQGEPVAPGETGELYLGGAGVARGYLGRDELTASRFVTLRGERLYRTGDVVRSDAEGNLSFVGRVDHQVKIRGHRIELGEIEACLAALEGVNECVVLCREDRPGDKRLVAYYVPRAQPLAPESLRMLLEERLPGYMVPKFYVSLARFPLTANGKIDRSALPKPSAADAGEAHVSVAPRTQVEQAMATLWAQLLDVPSVGIHDDFFALGGHSLLATRMVARVRDAFGVELALSQVFAEPTIEAAAPRIEALLYLRDAPSDLTGREELVI
jgi:amino acid adenylation domain-containing protein